MIHMVVKGRPVTKKNSQQLVYNKAMGRMFVKPSKAFEEYQKVAGWQISHKGERLNGRYNLCCVYYMPTRHRVDLGNLLAATCDILVHFNVLEDDNSRIVAGHDGSRVLYDKENPRVEITITEIEEE